MKLHRLLSSSRFLKPLALCTAIALVISGCVTQQQVREIVSNSNADILSAQIDDGAGALPTPNGGARPAWEITSEKIETFIATHPGQKTTHAALRIRQAMLLLANGQFNLARAAFQQADARDLHTARDQSLKKMQDHLLWWFGASTNVMGLADFKQADKALADMKTLQAGLSDSPGARDYFAEMRAWIALKSARVITDLSLSKGYFENAMTNYAAIFSADDLSALESGNPASISATNQNVDLRRCLRAEAVLRYAIEVRATNSLSPSLPPAFDRLTQTNSPLTVRKTGR